MGPLSLSIDRRPIRLSGFPTRTRSMESVLQPAYDEIDKQYRIYEKEE